MVGGQGFETLEARGVIVGVGHVLEASGRVCLERVWCWCGIPCAREREFIAMILRNCLCSLHRERVAWFRLRQSVP